LRLLLSLYLLVALVYGQQVGTNTAENHPSLSVSDCSAGGSCTSRQASVTLDSNWRWTHTTTGTTNCYTGNEWDKTLCPDPVTCATNCAIDGADYSGTYGITSSGSELTLKFVTKGPYSTNIGSRVYLLDTDTKYRMFKLKNKEFTFDVDVSGLPCGLNGALYFVAMDADGGMSKHPGNKAGAKYGTGYCDAQCPHDIKFINGEANTLNWKPSPNDKNAGTGQYGTCCFEMDVWESNSMATAYTPHVCSVQGQYRCNGTQCGDTPDNRYGGVCDKDGCDFNSWRQGVKNFFGSGFTVDTKSKFTVVTQYVTADGTDSGDLAEIRRIYVQNGKVIQNSKTTLPGIDSYSSISDKFCNDQKKLFGDRNDFETKGGLRAMGRQMDAGMVLVLSLWDDHDVHMLWLDSDYPTDKPASQPGISRGPCSTDSGKPEDVESQHPDATVKYSNIKFGPIGSTFRG